MARAIQTLYSAALGSAASVNVSLTNLQTAIGNEPCNVTGFGIRLSKTVASTVRPNPANVVIRDYIEPQFDGSFLEIISQMRERGEGIVAQLGAASAADQAFAIWRPGYGLAVEDSGHASALFQGGGSIQFTLPTDAGQTTNVEIVAFLDTNGGLRIANRAITRTLASTVREVPGDYKLARLRDASFAVANSFSVRTSQRELISAVGGATLQSAYESSLGPAGDPVVITAIAQTGFGTPNLVRSMLQDYSYGGGEKMPPIARLPNSDGNVSLQSGFTGSPIVTYLYPRQREEAVSLARMACARHGVAYRAPIPPGSNPELYPYLPLRLIG